jgi:hypothetical protein
MCLCNWNCRKSGRVNVRVNARVHGHAHVNVRTCHRLSVVREVAVHLLLLHWPQYLLALKAQGLPYTVQFQPV